MLCLKAYSADCSPDPPPVTTERYERALAIARANLDPGIQNDALAPRWTGDADAFWYLRVQRQGMEYLKVDATTGHEEPAFDPADLVAAIRNATGKPVDSRNLPVRELQYARDGQSVVVVTDLGSYACASSRAGCKTVPEPNPVVEARKGFFYQGAVASSPGRSPPGYLPSPDGTRAVFVRDHNLWVVDSASGEPRPLTSDGTRHHGYAALPDGSQIALATARSGREPTPWFTEWSPDSSRILTQRIDERDVPEYPFVTFAPPDGSPTPRIDVLRYPLLGQRPFTREPMIFDTRSGVKTTLALPPDLLTGDVDLDVLQVLSWSRDATHLYAIAYGPYMTAAHLLDVDVSTGNVRVVHTERGRPRIELNSSVYAPPNVVVIGDMEEFVWWSQRDGWGHLYLYDGHTGRLKRQLTHGNWLVGDIVQFDADSRQLYVTGYGREASVNPYYRQLYRVALSGKEPLRLTPEDADHPLLGYGRYVLHTDAPDAVHYSPVSPSGRYVAYGLSTPGEPMRFRIRETGTGRLVREFATADSSALAEAGWNPPRSYTAKAADGATDLYAQIYLPSDFCEERRYPLIDFVYPHPAVHQNRWNHSALAHSSVSPAAMAELGFVVVTIDGRGTVHRSRGFGHASDGHMERVGLEDHVALIDAMARDYAWIDRERIGIYGRSFGGYATIRALIEFPEVFRAGVAAAGPSSPQSMLDGIGWTAFQGRPRYSDGSSLQSRPGELPVNYRALHSPAQADRIRGRLMIQMGNLDEHVAPGSTLQMVSALVRDGLNFELVLLPDETHFLSFPYESLKRWDYFVQHLLGQLPPPWPEAGSAQASTPTRTDPESQAP